MDGCREVVAFESRLIGSTSFLLMSRSQAKKKARGEKNIEAHYLLRKSEDGSAGLLPAFSQVQMWQKTLPTQFMVWIYLLSTSDSRRKACHLASLGFSSGPRLRVLGR